MLAAPAPALSQSIESGKSDYLRLCALCHGLESTGLGPLREAMKIAPANLTLITRRHGGKFPADYVKRVITEGGGIRGHGSSAMLAWGPVFNAEQDGASPDARIEELTRYIESIQQR
ncbi:cytochrome c [Hyphomicrobium sp.]|uniref:c-type cytochrome n=1 Tax=Hyphomicrobium sp. TaxID=82 RepID=UPI0025C0CABC|nr:cytochrome c [Hyphomicrobium sp.]